MYTQRVRQACCCIAEYLDEWSTCRYTEELHRKMLLWHLRADTDTAASHFSPPCGGVYGQYFRSGRSGWPRRSSAKKLVSG